jgi:hypothetical protein
MASQHDSRILRLDRQQDNPLSASDYLAEYEAIIVRPEWQRLILTGPNMNAIIRSEEGFNRKAVELGDFLAIGGLLVVLPVPAEKRLFQTNSPFDNHSWWAMDIAQPYPGTPSIVTPGPGTSVEPTGVGSEFDEYLELNQSYQARLGSWFDNRDNVQILARNRAGGVIAAEVTAGPGTVICVPPPVDVGAEEVLLQAVKSFLGHRFGLGLKWPLPEEEELARVRQKLVAEFQLRMADVTSQQRAVQDRKRAVFERSQVRRGVRYFDLSTRSGATPKQTMDALYSLIEMLKDYYTTDWNGLADRLSVSHKSIDRIKTLANKKELHLRHTTAADPQGIVQADIDRTVADGRAILFAFIALEYADEVAKAPTT